MKTYTIGNLKGGVGKSTTTVNLAYEFSRIGKRVLVVDLDPQCNTTRFFAKVNAQGRTVRHALKHPVLVRPYRTKYENICIIKGSPEAEEFGNDYALREALALLEKQFDICLIDTRPVFDGLTRNGVYASDILLTPIKFDNFCRDNLALVEDAYHGFLETHAYLEWFVFANMATYARAQQKVSGDILARHDYPVLDTCISRSADVDNALNLYKPVRRHRQGSIVAEDFAELARELLERQGA